MSRPRHSAAGQGQPILSVRVPRELLDRLHSAVAAPEHGRQGKLSLWLLELIERGVSEAEEAQQRAKRGHKKV